MSSRIVVPLTISVKMVSSSPIGSFIESFPFHYAKKHGNPARYPQGRIIVQIRRLRDVTHFPFGPTSDESPWRAGFKNHMPASMSSSCLISFSISSKRAAASRTSSGHGRLE